MKQLFLLLFLAACLNGFAQQKVQHQSSAANTSNNSTYLDIEGLNGNPNAVIIVEYDGATRAANPHPVGVWYDGNKWAIFNQDRAAMPAGLTFSLTWKNADAAAFFVKASAANIINGKMAIDAAALNNKPTVAFYASQVWNPGGAGGVYNNADISVVYDQQLSKWLIQNTNGAGIPDGAAFNILLIGKTPVKAATDVNKDVLVTSGKMPGKQFSLQNIQNITGLIVPPPDKLNASFNRLSRITPLNNPQGDVVQFRETINSRKFDLRDYDCVTPVRHQGVECGSCFAFAPVAAYESSILKRNGGISSLLDFSEQQVLNCTRTLFGLTNRCGGGWHWDAAWYMKDVKYILTESEYPYRGVANDCNVQNPVSPYQVVDVIGVANVNGEASISQIKDAIIRFGSVAACIWFTDSMGQFIFKTEEDVFRKNVDNAGWGQIPNHVIQIIGWDDDKNAWLIKNCHGEEWGHNGFGWIEYGANVVGAFATAIQAKRISVAERDRANTEAFAAHAFPPETNIEAMKTRLMPTSVYEIQNTPNNMVVDVQDDALIKGTTVRQVTNHNGRGSADGRNQEWVFLYVKEVNNAPAYRIMNYGFRRFLTANPNPSAEAYSNQASGNNGQLWHIIPIAGRDKVYFQSVLSGRYLQAPAGNNEFEQYTLQPYSGNAQQQFTLITYAGYTGIRRQTDGIRFKLKAKYDEGKAIDVPNGDIRNGANLLHLLNNANNESQSFTFENRGNGIYKIKAQIGQVKCFTRFRSTLNTAEDGIILWDCDATHLEDQEWYIIPSVREDNTYIILNKKTGEALSAKKIGDTDKTILVMADYRDADHQRWKIPAN